MPRAPTNLTSLLGTLLCLLCAGPTHASYTDLEFADLSSKDGSELERLYQEASKSSKLEIGLVLGDFYASFAPHKTIAHLDELSQLRGPESGTAWPASLAGYSEASRCTALIRMAKLAEARDTCGEAEAALSEQSLAFIRLRVLSAVTFLFLQQGALEQALEYALRREQLAEQIGHPFLIARSLHSTAAVYTFSTLYAQALSRYEQAYRYLDPFDDHPLKRIISFNLGMSHRDMQAYEPALEAFQAGYEWASNTNQVHRALIAQVAMAEVLNQMGRPEESLSMLSEVLSAEESAHNPDTRLHAHLVSAQSEQQLGRLDRAMQIVQNGLPLAHKLGSKRRTRELELKRLAIEEQMGGYNNISEAQALVDEIRADSKTEILQPALNLLARLQASAGNYAEAYRLTMEVRDAQFDEMRNTDHRKLALLEVANELGRSERARLMAQAAEREMRASSERNRLMGIVGAILFLAALAVALFDYLRRRERQQGLVYRENSVQLEAQVAERTNELEDNMVKRMRAEEETRALEAELAESEKMRSLGQLTGGVAHDFNNLLTVVTAAAELLEENPNKSADERSKLLHAILGAAKSGREINSGLLAYARRQQLVPEPIMLNEFLANSRLMFQQTLGEGMSLTIDSDPLVILADHGQLTAAIMNLLTNAREASLGRGEVQINATSVKRQHTQMAAISIRDFGRGMTQQEAKRATEPFYSTKDGSLASGLGLSRVYGFVQQSGGTVTIESQVSEGTNIVLEFPVHVGQAIPTVQSAIKQSTELSILLVDDNQQVRHLVQEMLENLGHEVITSHNGEDALARVSEQDFELLVTDVLMPGRLSGPELARAIHDIKPELPILMISGFAEAPDLDFPLLSKPFSLDELKNAINQVAA